MKRTVIILILFALMAVGGEMLPQTQTRTDEVSLEASVETAPDAIIPDGLSPVIRVIDGDTIIVEVDGVQEKIRLIGVDTPEVVDPRKTVQCFGKEASEFTKNILTNARVRLESDPSQGERDRYGRLIRYVFLSDGTLLNKTIIMEGYGHEYTYRLPYRHQTEFKTAERIARESQKGLWAVGACDTSSYN